MAIKDVAFRLRALLRREAVESELDEELSSHLEMQTAEYVRRGLPLDEARRQARRSFGGVEQVKEECRDAWGVRFLETLAQDLRYGARGLRRNPGFAAVVVLTLGLGIGANTAVFSVVRGALLKPLPYERGEQVVVVRQGTGSAAGQELGFSVKDVEDYRDLTRSLDGLVEYHSMNFMLLGGPEPQRVRTGVVSAGFFEILEVAPLLGRTFQPGEDAPGADPLLVLSHDFWQRRLGGDPSVVGRRFEMNDRVHTVVGVLPPLPAWPDANDVFMPVSACPFRNRPANLEDRASRGYNAFARVKAGVSLEQARRDVEDVNRRLQREYPDAYAETPGVRATLTPLSHELTTVARPTFLVLLGTVGLILLIACANVANLMLARLGERGRELAVRAALGAGRGRILRQLLTETTLLALVGGAVGLLLALATRGALTSFAARFSPRAGEIQIDGAVLAFTLLVSLATGLVFGALPGLPGAERLARAALGDGARTTAGRSRRGLRSALVVSQLALSFLLLIGAALMLRSFAKLRQVDGGFVTQSVLAVDVDLNWSRYRTPERSLTLQRVLGFHDPLAQRVRALPGVRAYGNAATFPLNNDFRHDMEFEIEGRASPGAARPQAVVLGASEGYFDALGVPVLRGRCFEERDAPPSPGVAVVSRSLARRHFGDADPVGLRLRLDRGDSWRVIVGVVGDVRQYALSQPVPDMIYLPFREFPGFSSTAFVRTQGEPRALADELRRLIHALDPQAAVVQVKTLDEIRHEALASPRLTTLLLATFAGLALAISAAGVGGVIAYSVSQRTQEIGVRMALGAEPRRVLGMLLRQGMASVLLGLGLGVLGALGLARLISGLLFGVEPTDPLCFAGSALLFVIVAGVACLVPARRATAIQPMIALRAE
jgi:predicted permease